MARFECAYPVEIVVSSGPYTVTPTSVDPTESTPLTGTGTLADAFKLNFDSADAGMVAGSQVETTLSFEMESLSDVTFYFHQCQVETGTFNVKIIDGGCFSQALNVSPGPASGKEIKMSYMAFTDAATQWTEQVQTLQCTVRLCLATCAKPTTDEDCPTSGDAASYQYKAYGV